MTLGRIKRIHVANADRAVEAEVVKATFQDMVVWDRLIQKPFVSKSGQIGSDWNWPARYVACRAVERTAGRACLAYQIRVCGANKLAVPVSQAIVSVGYYWPGDLQERCAFIWLICSAPENALKHQGVHDRFATLDPMLDIAIEISRAAGYSGRLGLHVADEGTAIQRDALRERYRTRGFKSRPVGKGWFSWPVRREDGDLMYLTAEDAAIVTIATADLK